MTDQLAEKMVRAGIAAVDFDPDEDAVETIRTALAAALRAWQVHAIEQGRQDIPREVGDLAARIEHPAEDGER